jgi:hypothetical protein
VFKLRFFSKVLVIHNANWMNLVCAEIKAGSRKGVLKNKLVLDCVGISLVAFTSATPEKSNQFLVESWDVVWSRLKLEKGKY